MNTEESKLLTVVIPLYNEGENIQKFATEVVTYCFQRGWKVIFVNDGSRDNTREILDKFMHLPDVQILHHKVNRGYGGALKSGIRKVDTPFLVTIDGDGQHSLEDIDNVFGYLLHTNADMVVGKRDKKNATSVYRQFGKFVIHNFAKILMSMPISDLNSGFKLYRSNLAKKYITVCPDTMAFSDVITMVFLNERNLVVEYPIHISTRKGGQSKYNIFIAFGTLMQVLNISLMFHPLRVFLPLSACCFLAGIGWGLPIVVMGRGVSVGAMLAIVTGLLFFVLGLLANQLSEMRMERLRSISE